MEAAEEEGDGDPRSRVLPPAYDLSSAELVASVVTDIRDGGDDPPLGHLVALHERPTQFVFEQALALARSSDEALQVAGLMILRELGPEPRRGVRTFAAEATAAIEPIVAAATAPAVIRWGISALGYQSGAQSLDLVLSYTTHPDESVRFAVAAAIPGLVNPEDVPAAAVAALERLLVDANADVRYYAAAAIIDDLDLLPRISSEIVAAAAEDPDDQVAALVKQAMQGGA